MGSSYLKMTIKLPFAHPYSQKKTPQSMKSDSHGLLCVAVASEKRTLPELKSMALDRTLAHKNQVSVVASVAGVRSSTMVQVCDNFIDFFTALSLEITLLRRTRQKNL